MEESEAEESETQKSEAEKSEWHWQRKLEMTIFTVIPCNLGMSWPCQWLSVPLSHWMSNGFPGLSALGGITMERY